MFVYYRFHSQSINQSVNIVVKLRIRLCNLENKYFYYTEEHRMIKHLKNTCLFHFNMLLHEQLALALFASL